MRVIARCYVQGNRSSSNGGASYNIDNRIWTVLLEDQTVIYDGKRLLYKVSVSLSIFVIMLGMLPARYDLKHEWLRYLEKIAM